LIEHGSVHQIPAILELINNNVDLGKRYESKELFVVLDRLIMQGKVDAVPYLVQGIKHRSFFIREYALIYLLALGGRNALGAIPALIEVLGDPHAELRTHAAIILGEIGPEANAAVPALKSLIEDESESVRLFAKRAIVQIQGEESP
jgi:HEAT repeat protein